MIKRALVVSCIAAIGLVAVVADAHHNEGYTYTRGQPIRWVGTVRQVSWDGAHVMYRLEVAGANGEMESWQVLGGSPFRLARRGIFQKTVHVGDTVTVAGYLNRSNNIVTPVYLLSHDGQKLFVGYRNDDLGFSAP